MSPSLPTPPADLEPIPTDRGVPRDTSDGRMRPRLGRGLLAIAATVALLAGTTAPVAAQAATSDPTKVVAWGDNVAGSTRPPGGLTDVTAVAAGDYHNLALHSDGTVTAWGFNAEGQTNVPAGLSGVTAIAAGWQHNLAVSNGTVTAWGMNSGGQLDVPAGLTDVVAVAAGTDHSLALKSDGTLVTWGGTCCGQTALPAGLDDIIAIDASNYQNIALHRTGTVTTWGWSTESTVPDGLTGVTAVATGYNHSLALKNDGTVIAWGRNTFGQTDVPAGLTDVGAIAAGANHSVALKSDGTVVAWGDNGNNQLALPDGLTGVTAISAGVFHSIALTASPAFTADAPPTTATVGTPYSYTFAASSASTFELSSGNLPAGLTLTSAGVLSGTPTAEGDSAFTVRARNASGTTPSANHTITVGAAAITPTIAGTAPDGAVSSTYDYTYTVTGTPTPDVALASGTLPPGLALDETGRLTGIPTIAGTYTFTVAATNTAGTATTDSSLTIAPTPAAPTISGAATDGVVGAPYDYTYTVTGTPTPEVSIYSGTFPGGLTLDKTGRLSGTPTQAGTFYFTVAASNSSGTAMLVQTSLTVISATVAPTISGSAAPGVVGSAYDYTYTVSGNPTPEVTVTSGALPPGLILDETGHLTGTPTAAGTYAFAVAATSTAGNATADSILTIDPAPVAPTISGTVAAGIVGSAYDYTYTVTGTPTPDVTLSSGTLPPGLTLDRTGRLSGTPTKAGTYIFRVGATNTVGTATAESTVTISPKAVTTKADLSVDIAAPTTASKGKTYVYTVTTRNAGPATSSSVHTKVILPPNTQFVSATGKYTRIGSLVIFQRSTLTNGQSVVDKISVKATGTGKGTALATIFSVKTPDPAIRNNADTTTTTMR